MPRQYNVPTREPILPIGPSIAYIPLSRGQFALIDACDAALVGRWNWHANWSDFIQGYYAERNMWVGGGRQIRISLHSFIAQPAKGFIIDHRNHNTLDNRRVNLRQATVSQNAINRRHVGTRVRGVLWHKQSKKWEARICIDGRRRTVGRFRSYEEAVACRRDAESAHYGEFVPS